MKSKNYPILGVNKDKTVLTVIGMPGVKIQVNNPFNGMDKTISDDGVAKFTERDGIYQIEPSGSIGRITAPQYYLMGNEGNTFINKFVETAQSKYTEKEELSEFDGVGAKTIAVLEAAKLFTSDDIVAAGKEKLLEVGVHRAIVNRLLEKAQAAITAAKSSKEGVEVQKFFSLMEKENFYYLELLVKVEDPALVSNITFFYVDGKKNVQKARPQIIDGVTGYCRNVPIKLANTARYKGIFHTEICEDTLRYIITYKNGSFKSGDISLVSQMGEFFVSVQEIYNSQAFLDGGRIRFPEFEKRRPQFCEFWARYANWNFAGLPKITDYKARPEFDYTTLLDNQAYVNFFSVAQRTGMVTIRKIDPETEKFQVLKLHYTQIEIEERSQLARLNAGDIVEFDEIAEHKSTSFKPSMFKHEVIGVRVPEVVSTNVPA